MVRVCFAKLGKKLFRLQGIKGQPLEFNISATSAARASRFGPPGRHGSGNAVSGCQSHGEASLGLQTQLGDSARQHLGLRMALGRHQSLVVTRACRQSIALLKGFQETYLFGSHTTQTIVILRRAARTKLEKSKSRLQVTRNALFSITLTARELAVQNAYCGVLLRLPGQEPASCDSAPSRVAPSNSLKNHSSATNWCSIIIQVSLDSCADGAARAGLPRSRPLITGGPSPEFLILLESSIKLPRT